MTGEDVHPADESESNPAPSKSTSGFLGFLIGSKDWSDSKIIAVVLGSVLALSVTLGIAYALLVTDTGRGIGLALIVFAAVGFAIMRARSSWEAQAAKRKIEADSQSPVATRPTRREPWGFLLSAISLGVGVVIVLIATVNLAHQWPTDGSGFADGVMPSFLTTGGIGGFAVVVGIFCINRACPKCRLLFTGVIVQTDSLGTHLETRREERVAKHYHNDLGSPVGPAYSQTHYNVDRQVEVTTLLHTKYCKSCGHVWRSKEHREN